MSLAHIRNPQGYAPARLDDSLNIPLNKSGGNAGSYEHPAEFAVPIVRHRSDFLRKVRRHLGISRGDQSPAVDKNLPTDLFGDSDSVLFDGPGTGALMPFFKLR